MRTPKLEPRIRKQIPCSKIKLQLFPINENTRQALEKDGYNPFLELTLSAKKKISSVIRHLSTKWGSSSVAVGQLVLFPYTMKFDQLPSSRRWTSSDSAITAWDVYLAVKTSSLFRLRYGWCSNQHLKLGEIPPKSCPLEGHVDSAGNGRACSRTLEVKTLEEKLGDGHETGEGQQEEENIKVILSDAKELKASNLPNHMGDEVVTEVTSLQSTVPWDDNLTNLSIGGLLSEISLMGKISGSDANMVKEPTILPSRQISNISIADLLSEASLQQKISSDMKSENKSPLQPIWLTSSDISVGGLLSEASLLSNKRKSDTQLIEGRFAQFQSSWDDSLTTLSIGGLLSEASLLARVGCKLETKEGKPNLQPNASLADSFDAFLAAQLKADSQMLKLTCHESRSSILDAEDTCHAFPFQKFRSSTKDAPTSNSTGRYGPYTNSEFFQFPKVAKMDTETELANDISCSELKTIPLPLSLGTTDE